MDILFLTHQIPNQYLGATIRPFHLIKNFSEEYNYNISLISFVTDMQMNYVDEIKRYCQNTLFLPLRSLNNRRIIAIETLRNTLSPKNIISKIKSKNGVFDPSYYAVRDIQKRIDGFIERYRFDAVYSDAGMAGYVANSSLPKIVEPLDINYKNWLHYSIKKSGFPIKIYWLIRFLQTMYREIYIYKKFDYCVVVTENDKKSIDRYLQNVIVIPNGVDTDYFKPIDIEDDYPSLIFTGAMNGGKNIDAVMYFYSEIYPIVRKRYPEITFYIVGNDPHPEIQKLGRDPSVVVTGFVEDIRLYLSKSSVFVCPYIYGSGMKNKVLEAMAMGKPVVSTPTGALGIDISDGENIVIADNPKDFAMGIINLLDNEKLRQKIGYKGRRLIENRYSWGKTTDKLQRLFEQIVR